MTNTALEPELWQHLVQWQPATAAALAAHIRSLPDDWPMRVFGVGRADAAFLLPPGATGEQFPDRAPEIAPYDEIAPLDDCPACTEAEGNCRFHEGFAAGHHEAVQAQLDAVKAQPGMGLREFMRWRADVEEAEDRGQEPPAMPVPAAAPAAVEPPADQTALRDRIAEAALAAVETALRDTLTPDARAEALAGITAVLPEPADRATVLNAAAQHLYTALFPAVYNDLGQKAAEGVNRAVSELRRMADETATTDIEASLADGPVRCPLCPTPLTLHTPSGARAHFTTVHPEQRITGRESGPWPLLVADETATTETRVCKCPAELCGCGHHPPAAGARQDEPTALGLLPLLTSPEPCRWDGPVCTTHSWRSDIGRCPHAQAQALLGGDPR